MRKVIACADLRVGMFVHRIGLPWWRTPFWRPRLLLKTDAQVALLRGCGIDSVEIDEARGEVAPSGDAAPAARHLPARPPASPREPAPAGAPKRRAFGQRDPRVEQEEARATLAQAQQAVRGLFSGTRVGAIPSLADVAPVVDTITEAVLDNRSALLRICRIKTKSHYTYLHSIATCALMVNLARQMQLGDEAVREAGAAGLLHDIGKVTIDQAVLDKAGALTDAEQAQVRTHPAAGRDLLLRGGATSATIIDVCLHHHERMDGSGYPLGLAGDALGRSVRMAMICDVYDSLTTAQPHRAAYKPAAAIARMMAEDGKFDRAILGRFMQSIGVFPVGTLVRLRTNRLGVVSEMPDDNGRPVRVRAFFAVLDQGFRRGEGAVIGDTLRDDQIVSVEAPEQWFPLDWERLREDVLAGRDPGVARAEALAG